MVTPTQYTDDLSKYAQETLQMHNWGSQGTSVWTTMIKLAFWICVYADAYHEEPKSSLKHTQENDTIHYTRQSIVLNERK